MKNNRRALRRFHTQRIYRKRKKSWIAEYLINLGISEEDLKKRLKTPVGCTCWMCGNPRKYHNEKTIQELKAEEKFRLDMKDLAA